MQDPSITNRQAGSGAWFPVRGAWIVALLHGLLAAVLYWRGMRFYLRADQPFWNLMWHTIPIEDLLQCPGASLWALHVQPPGFNLWGLFWLKVAGLDGMASACQVAQIVLGCLVVDCTMRVAHGVSGSRRLTLTAGGLMAVNPALLMFEAYPLYEMLTIALLTGAAACLWGALSGAAAGRGRWTAAGFVLLAMTLVMTRSFYHPLFLAAALGCAWPVWRGMRPGRRMAWWTAALALPLALCVKNQVQYGFFGTSSWFGLGFYKSVSSLYTHDELAALSRQGLMPSYIPEMYPYKHPIREYRPLGFNKSARVPMLERDCLHNINIPDISREYQKAAVRVMLHDPLHFARTVTVNYGLFCVPPARFPLIAGILSHWMKGWEPFFTQPIYGSAVADWIEISTRFNAGSLFFIYFPMLLAGAALFILRRRHDADPMQRARAWMMGFLLVTLLYVAAVGCLFETDENMRFRFAIEPFTLILTLLCLRWGWRRCPASVRQWLRPPMRRAGRNKLEGSMASGIEPDNRGH